MRYNASQIKKEVDMYNKFKQMSLKYRIIIIIAAAVFIFALVNKFNFQQYFQYYYNYKFNAALEKAAKISPDVWDKKYQDIKIKDKYKVVIITNNGGEASYVDYFKYAAEKAGWEVQIYFNQTLGHEEAILAFDPDFIIFSAYADNNIMYREIYGHRSKKYALFLSPLQLIKGQFRKNRPYEPEGSFQNLLNFSHGVLTSSKEVDFYRVIFDNAGKPFNGLQILPLAPKLINEPAEPKSLMWMSGGWDKFRSSSNYKKFINMLAETVPMKVYGHYYAASFLKPNTYDGYIPSSLEIFDALRKNGIYLLTHSEQHINADTPTLRIFEAVAANVVVISDMHPFAIENFGDNFLYFDQNADAETMYKQVKAHMDWIKANPEKAKAMAARAHQIYLEKFTLDKDLSRIAKMHEYILAQEKKMSLSYAPAY